MGLGLSIAQAIVEAHGGTIRAVESPEGGARIEMELMGFEPGLPAAAAPAEGPIRAFSRDA
jgi:signal transduction histidine kinase